jgi:hypothetical protein
LFFLIDKWRLPNGEATSTKKSSEKETPVDHILELCRGGCTDGWIAHFSPFGMTAKTL